MIFFKKIQGGFDILMSQKGQVKKIPAFQGCAKVVCFPAWHGHSALKGRVLIFFLWMVSTISSIRKAEAQLLWFHSIFVIFWDLQGPKIAPKMAQTGNSCSH